MKKILMMLAFGVTFAPLVMSRPALSDEHDLSHARHNTTSTAIFFGGDVGPSAETGYAGAVGAFNKDFGQDGFLWRVLGVYGEYDYDAVVGNVDGRFTFADAMLGYQILRGTTRAAGYIGVEYQEHDLSIFDPTNPVQGDEVGFKVAGDVQFGRGQPWQLAFAGSYSTAFDTYWSRVRTGYNFGQVTVGPEALFGGNESSDYRRFGGFLDIRFSDLPVSLELAGGYHNNSDGGIFGDDDGGYGSVNLGFSF